MAIDHYCDRFALDIKARLITALFATVESRISIMQTIPTLIHEKKFITCEYNTRPSVERERRPLRVTDDLSVSTVGPQNIKGSYMDQGLDDK